MMMMMMMMMVGGIIYFDGQRARNKEEVGKRLHTWDDGRSCRRGRRGGGR